MIARTPAAGLSRLSGYVALVLVGLLPLGAVCASTFAPPADGPVAALFPPWWDQARSYAAAAAAGPVVRFGAVPFIVVVAATDRARLRAAGAWALLDPCVTGGCGPAWTGRA